jgi:hypothetical protein
MHLQARITAYDAFDSVQWTVKVWDLDQVGSLHGDEPLDFTGAMRGRGAERPTKWLRELLEDIRASM